MHNQFDDDQLESQEWLEAFAAVIQHKGNKHAATLLEQLAGAADHAGIVKPYSITTPYRNTIAVANQQPFPGDTYMERRIRSFLRWNAMVMVMRANADFDGIGGHISTYMSATTLYEVGMNHFFRGEANGLGDLIFYQGHSAPGIYARSYLEGRFDEQRLVNYRQEAMNYKGKIGLSSYPHPHLMNDYWQFPTVSMGLGPLQAIYQALFMQYLNMRELVHKEQRKVWCFIGDGETDEPETLGSIALAGRENLDNLIFVVNCNLQRLDGPVRGNGKIIQELEGVFRGAGWNVIKVIWGNRWDPLLQSDSSGVLQKLMDETVDGEYQSCKSKGGKYTRENFFGKYPELKERVAHLSDDDILRLNRGGHDIDKVYAAYHSAVHHTGQPTVILAKTVKGYGTGIMGGESLNTAHSLKKLSKESLLHFRDRFDIPILDKNIEAIPFVKFEKGSQEETYLLSCRERLGGCIPSRRTQVQKLEVPALASMDKLLKGSNERAISTTMAFVRILNSVVKDKVIGKLVVPIVPDEARTFGMEGMFRQLGIFTSEGQKYTPEDSDQVMYYREDKQGQILECGINEAGSFCAWMAAATSGVHNDQPMIPFYIFYSMFGFQRIGDFAWAAGDMQSKGFLIGAISGRTSLPGEGLQHLDGHSHIQANHIPNCTSYDPTYMFELAVIIQDGIRRMYYQQENVYYYITVGNENYVHPAMPKDAEQGIIAGVYKLIAEKPKNHHVRLLGSGAILREVIAAKQLIAEYNISADVYSVTSFNNLVRDIEDCDRMNMLDETSTPRTSLVQKTFGGSAAPVIVATDYVRNYSERIRCHIDAPLYALGTDGFGRSDTRANLRHFFEVDANHIAWAALRLIADAGGLTSAQLQTAKKKLGINPKKPNPVSV